MITRRSLFLGATTLLAAPAIVRASSLMAVKAPPLWGESRMGSQAMLALQAEANARMQRMIDAVLDRVVTENQEVIQRAVVDRVIGIPGALRYTEEGFVYERITPGIPAPHPGA